MPFDVCADPLVRDPFKKPQHIERLFGHEDRPTGRNDFHQRERGGAKVFARQGQPLQSPPPAKADFVEALEGATGVIVLRSQHVGHGPGNRGVQDGPFRSQAPADEFPTDELLAFGKAEGARGFSGDEPVYGQAGFGTDEIPFALRSDAAVPPLKKPREARTELVGDGRFASEYF